MTGSQRGAGQRNVPDPSASTSRRCAKGSINGTPLAEIFTHASVMPFELTRDEIVRADETRGIFWRTFSMKFGSQTRNEWPKCTRVPGYTKFLCADITAQPYVPTSPGKPGLILRLPTTVLTPQDDGHTFHVFSSCDGLLHYQGEYTRSHLPHAELDWNDLISDVSVSKACYMILYVSNFGCSARTFG